MVGFVEKRLHNQSLHTIIQELLHSYYVSINPMAPIAWSPEKIRATISGVPLLDSVANAKSASGRPVTRFRSGSVRIPNERVHDERHPVPNVHPVCMGSDGAVNRY